MTILLIALFVFMYVFVGGVISKAFDCTEIPICLYFYAFWPIMPIPIMLTYIGDLGADFTEFVQNKFRKENKK